jgi:integrase
MSDKLSYSSCHKVKVVAVQLFDFAMADDIVDRNYAKLVEMPDDTSNKREPFSDIEIKNIETYAKTDIWANTILILIYTGMRIGELLSLTRFNIDIEHMLIVGGSKTDAGKDRVIPIHPKIQKYIVEWYNNNTDYLITRNGSKIRINYYRNYLFYPALEKTGARKLTPHSARHTFGTLLDKAGANTKSIQELIGHADYSTTANIYTHPDVKKLRSAIEMMD